MKKRCKKIITITLCFFIIGMLAGCGSGNNLEDGKVSESGSPPAEQTETLPLEEHSYNSSELELSFYPSGSHFIESIINERGKVPVTEERRRLFNHFARDFQFNYLPELDYYESFFDADTYAESFGYNNFGYAVFYVLSYLNCPEKISAKAMGEAIQTMFVAKESYKPMEHQVFQKIANYENGFYSCWPEGGLDQERLFYLLTGLDIEQNENKGIYITLYGKSYYFNEPTYTPGEQEEWLANKSEELGLSPMEAAEELIVSGEIAALEGRKEFKTILYVNLEADNPDGYHPRFVFNRELVDGYDLLYDFDLIYDYKNTPNSDVEKIKALIGQLQHGQKLPVNLIDYSDPAFLRVDFSMGLTEGQNYHGDPTQIMADAIMLFALQDELEAVHFRLVQEDYSYEGLPITRKEAKEVFGESIEPLGETKELFLTKMPEKIGRLKWEQDIMTMISYEHIIS